MPDIGVGQVGFTEPHHFPATLLLERQLFLRSRLELRRAVHSEDHVAEFLTHYTSTWTSMLGDWRFSVDGNFGSGLPRQFLPGDGAVLICEQSLPFGR